MKRRVSLFVTCLVDQLRPEIGRATVKVLEKAGCEVEFDAYALSGLNPLPCSARSAAACGDCDAPKRK